MERRLPLHKAQVALTPEQRYEAREAMRGRTSDSAEDHLDEGHGSRYEVFEETACPTCGQTLHGIHRVRPNGSVDPRAASYDDNPDEAEETADRRNAESALKSLAKAGTDLATREQGVMVALYPDPKVARSLAIPGGDPPDQLHVTLGYFGKVDDLSTAQQNRLVNITHHLANLIGGFPLEGRVSGLGYFQNPASDQEVLYASVDVPGLNSVYEWLLRQCRAAGLPMSGDHGFQAHVTLKYQPVGTPRPKRGTPLPPLHFTPGSLVCKIGETKHTFEPGDTECPACGLEECGCIEMADTHKSFRYFVARNPLV